MNPAPRLVKIPAARRQGLACVLGVALLVCAACAAGPSAAADPGPDDAESVGDLGAIRRGTLRSVLLLTGELQALHGEAITIPRLPSWETAIRWMAEDGAWVAEGDRLIELDTAQIASELDNKITARQQALNAIAAKQAEIDGLLAQKTFAVARTEAELRKAQIEASIPAELRTRKNFEQAKLAFEQAQVENDKAVVELEGYRRSSAAELGVERIDLDTANREVGEARDAIATMVVRAPQSGIAVAAENRREGRKFQEGDSAWVGARVMEIPDLSVMVIEAHLSDVDDGKIAPGMPVTCTLDAYPTRQFGGVIRDISPVAQEAEWRSLRRRFLVRIDLDVTDSEIMRPGMSARVEVESAHRVDEVLVPRQALVFEDDGVFVVFADGRREPVTLGPCNGFECVLEDGPPPGTPVGRGS